MNETRDRIRKIGKALSVILLIARIGVLLMMVLSLVAAFAIAANGNLASTFQELYQDNPVYQGLSAFRALEGMEQRFSAAVGCMITAITFAVLLHYIRHFQQLMNALVQAESPFTVAAAKQVRRAAFGLLITVLYDPLLAVVLFLLVLLLSYLIEYGASLQEIADETNRIQEEMIVSFAEITENKSGQTGQHVKRVSEYARVIAAEMGLDAQQVENIRLASTMHDIGKLLIPPEILEKPGRLTEAEFSVIKQHPVYGGQLLEHVDGEVMDLSRTIALQHHERVDGKGYPAGITGEDISLAGRIVAVADVYDALTSKRSYKEAWAEDQAYGEIVRNSGGQFDPQVVKAFQQGYPQIQEIRARFLD